MAFLLDNSACQGSFDYLRLGHLYSLRILKDILAPLSGKCSSVFFKFSISDHIYNLGPIKIPYCTSPATFSVSRVFPHALRLPLKSCSLSETLQLIKRGIWLHLYFYLLLRDEVQRTSMVHGFFPLILMD